jgi:hypothetical protein
LLSPYFHFYLRIFFRCKVHVPSIPFKAMTLDIKIFLASVPDSFFTTYFFHGHRNVNVGSGSKCVLYELFSRVRILTLQIRASGSERNNYRSTQPFWQWCLNFCLFRNTTPALLMLKLVLCGSRLIFTFPRYGPYGSHIHLVPFIIHAFTDWIRSRLLRIWTRNFQGSKVKKTPV